MLRVTLLCICKAQNPFIYSQTDFSLGHIGGCRCILPLVPDQSRMKQKNEGVLTLKRPNRRSLRKTVSIFEGTDLEPTAEIMTGSPKQNAVEARSDVFDKLSKTLGDLAAGLGKDEANRELSLRSTLVKTLEHYAGDKLKTGQMLHDYKAVYKTKRQWTSVAEEIGTAIQCSARTIFRLVDDYKASLVSTMAMKVEIDRTEIDGPVLSKSEKQRRNARMAIRVFLNNHPGSERLKMLGDLLAEEAHQVWGKRVPFSIEIKVTPRPSSLTIDGRRKMPTMAAGEKAA